MAGYSGFWVYLRGLQAPRIFSLYHHLLGESKICLIRHRSDPLLQCSWGHWEGEGWAHQRKWELCSIRKWLKSSSWRPFQAESYTLVYYYFCYLSWLPYLFNSLCEPIHMDWSLSLINNQCCGCYCYDKE